MQKELQIGQRVLVLDLVKKIFSLKGTIIAKNRSENPNNRSFKIKMDNGGMIVRNRKFCKPIPKTEEKADEPEEEVKDDKDESKAVKEKKAANEALTIVKDDKDNTKPTLRRSPRNHTPKKTISWSAVNTVKYLDMEVE